ncbi:MAG: sigma-54-dependent Fis family transcriptional regulator, partial [Planctomycetes bacterium]|nr:sigma-54-dependent Fis family transcriptional regulator [Planctomycetota bacterium]
LFQQLADAGLAATGTARAVVLLPQPPATDLTPHSVRRAAKQDPAFIEIAKSFAERAMGESMAMLVRLQPSVSLYVPIRGSEETHGVLYLEGEGGEGLGEEDLQLLLGLAHQAGLALEHLRARQESAERGGHWLRTLRTERILVGKSEPMKAVFNRLLKAAASDAPVLLRGEPGTGKELAARFIYLHGARHDSPFVAINFATLPTEQHEAALFGGVPPGADKDHPGSTAKPPLPGAFQEAMAGTLLLAEIGQLSEQAQDRLVTALLEGRVAGTPSAKEPAATVRVIAATSKRLERLVAQGQFRSEIHCQLSEVDVELPSLRDRLPDIPDLARHFLDRYGHKAAHPVTKISADAMDMLMNYPWPGNVRQLKNCIEAAVLAAKKDEIMVEDLPSHVL